MSDDTFNKTDCQNTFDEAQFKMDPDEMAQLETLIKEYDIHLPNGLRLERLDKYWDVRRPLILLRGKPITREQVKQLITGEEPLFEPGEDNTEKAWFDRRNFRGSLKNIFYRQGYSWLSSWVYSDGTIGGDIIAWKYPDADELIEPYVHLAKKYPFLDMVVSFTTYDESCCYGCDYINKKYSWSHGDDCGCKDCVPFLDLIHYYEEKEWERYPDFRELFFRSWDTDHIRSDVHESVEMALWIHDGMSELLFGEQAKQKCSEYNEKYSSAEYAFMFSSSIYHYDKTCICDREFVKECFEYVGMSSELCDSYVEQGFISPFNPSAQVVTKDWVRCQYRKFIEEKK